MKSLWQQLRLQTWHENDQNKSFACDLVTSEIQANEVLLLSTASQMKSMKILSKKEHQDILSVLIAEKGLGALSDMLGCLSQVDGGAHEAWIPLFTGYVMCLGRC